MDHQPITTTQSDDQPKVYFADLRHEVELAARRHAELNTALDLYADELSHIAFAVTGDRDGTIGFDQIVDHVKAVVAERDQLRAVVAEMVRLANRLLTADDEALQPAGMALRAGCDDALAALDGSPTIGDVETEPPWRVTYYSAEGERVTYLRIGTTALALPALEAHKLGSALHAASGLDVTPDSGGTDG
jgi:hypothetical protein